MRARRLKEMPSELYSYQSLNPYIRLRLNQWLKNEINWAATVLVEYFLPRSDFKCFKIIIPFRKNSIIYSIRLFIKWFASVITKVSASLRAAKTQNFKISKKTNKSQKGFFSDYINTKELIIWVIGPEIINYKRKPYRKLPKFPNF